MADYKNKNLISILPLVLYSVIVNQKPFKRNSLKGSLAIVQAKNYMIRGFMEQQGVSL